MVSFLLKSFIVIAILISLLVLFLNIKSILGYARIYSQDIYYQHLPYKDINGFQAFCGHGNQVVTSSNEYEEIKVKYDQNPEFCDSSKLPNINFDENVLILSSIQFGDCDKILPIKLYKNDKNKKILHVINIFEGTSVCTLALNFKTQAVLIPKIPGYTIGFQTTRY